MSAFALALVSNDGMTTEKCYDLSGSRELGVQRIKTDNIRGVVDE
jgi:hypothetical protein